MENHLQQQGTNEVSEPNDSLSEEYFLYGTLESWSQVLDISRRKLTKCLKNIEYIFGKDKLSRVCRLYEESEVRREIEKILTVPNAADVGFLFVEDKKYGSLKYLSKVLKISPSLLKKHSVNVKSIRARTIKRYEHALYCEDDMKRECADYLNNPITDESGFFEMNGIVYGLVNSWAKKFGITQKTMRDGLNGDEFITVKDRCGRLSKAYSQNHASRIAEIKNIPMADRKGGMLIIEGAQYATVLAWASHYGISYDILLRRL